jgi:hypothetical protein
MSNALRMFQLFCILLLVGLVAGCGDEETSPVVPPITESQAGTIGVYADADGMIGSVRDAAGQQMAVYVVHKVEDGVTGSTFRVQAPSGWSLVSAEPMFAVTIGDVEDGVSIGYGRCAAGAIHLMTLTYRVPDATPAGEMFRVLPHTLWPNAIQVVDCDNNLLENGRGQDTPLVEAVEVDPPSSERPRARQE